MADDIRPHPPTQRRLGRLWSAGITPASPALVALAPLAVAWAVVAMLGSILVEWAGDMVADALRLAAHPEAALAGIRVLVLRAALVTGGLSALIMVAAAAAQTVQGGPRSSIQSAAPTPPGVGQRLRPAFELAHIVCNLAVLVLAVVTLAAAVRAVLCRAGDLATVRTLPAAAADLASAIGWPVLALLAGVAVLDAIVRRAAWTRMAWMTHREMEDEVREAEGHRLTRQRRTSFRGRKPHA